MGRADQKDLIYAVWRWSHVGFLLGTLTVGGFFLGWWIDGFLGTFPIVAILFFLIGFALGFYRLILIFLEDKNKK